MKLFLSYPSLHRPLAERLALALEGEGHAVFVDRADLKAGEPFHQALREAIADADAMVFLITPEAVAAGSYCLTELGLAQARWRHPSGRVLPIMVAATPIAALPAYLSAVTVLAPRGELVAEVVAAVALMRPGVRRHSLALAVLALALAAGVGGVVWWQAGLREADRAALAVSQARSARQLCLDGSHEAALAQLASAASLPATPAAVRLAEQDCAMQWLREMRATIGQKTFGEQVAVTQPILSAALVQASGPRAADLRAHLGWGEYLRGRDGTTVNDPVAHWKRALDDDPASPYAHGMWARRLLDAPVDLAAAKLHFAQAVAAQRELPFVRALQLGGTLGGRADFNVYAVTVADAMRRSDEAIETRQRERLWTYAFATNLLDPERRALVLAALPPADLLATYVWLFPPAEVREDQRALWHFGQATLLAHSGATAGARTNFESLVAELRADKRSGRLLDQAVAALNRLKAPPGPTTGARPPKATR